MSTIAPERLALLDTITLDKGLHRDFNDGHCAMEVVAWLAGEGSTDAPDCASPVLRRYTIALNDQWGYDQRQKLKPYLPGMVGTRGDGLDEQRSYLALDWLIRSFTPAWLDLAGLAAEAKALRDLRRIVDLVAAKEARPVVRAAQKKADATRAAGDATWAAWAAGDATRAAWAARDATWAAWAARDAAWAARAAGDATRAAWDATRAARDAAWAAWAAGDALRPTAETLQQSTLDLLDRMIVAA